MKKILTYFVGFIFICFILPVICTKTSNMESSKVSKNENIEIDKNLNQVEKVETEKYNYGQYNKIKLLHII